MLGHFAAGEATVRAVVELKGPKTHLDRDRPAGRTAVDQCWDYLVNLPTTCRWGMVSNYISGGARCDPSGFDCVGACDRRPVVGLRPTTG